MKVDTHVLLLILIVGIISAGLVGANVLNTDQSMKQQVFDGIKISVPSDSNFVKIGEGVYKDSGYGITINTFKNNNSMISFLKNTNNSKVVPIKNQPPQSVAFKKGDTISIMVTNGQEGVSISSKDGELTSKIANNIVFSNNHRSEKPSGLNIINPPMDVHDDFNLIMLLVADVDTKIFNQAIIQDNLIIVANDFNENANNTFFFSPNVEVTNMEDNADSNNILTANSNSTTTLVESSSQGSGNNNTAVSSSSSGASSQGSSNNNTATSSSGSSASSQGSNDELVNSLFGQDSSKNNAAGSDAASPSSSSSQSAPVSAQQSSSSSASSSPSSSSSSSSPSSSSSGSSSSSSSSANTPQKLSLSDCKGLAQKVISHKSGLSIDGYDESGDSYVFHIKDKSNKNVGDIVVDATSGNVDSSGLRP